MSGPEALAILQRAGRPFFSSQEAALLLGVSSPSATQILTGLANHGLIGRIRRGHWSVDPTPKPMAYASWVTTPLPSYVSVHTALYHHGMIEQIPSVIYVVSLGKTERVDTRIGVYSVHQIAPPLFGGYEEQEQVRMATPEKAVFDFLYLERGGSGLFAGLPEVEIPPSFRVKNLTEWVDRIPDKAVRRRVSTQVNRFVHDEVHSSFGRT